MYKYFILFLALIFSGCEMSNDPESLIDNQGNTQYKPVLMEKADLDKTISFSEPQAMIQPGKFYVYPPYVLVNERFEGIHIIDNSDPYNPQPKGFIRIPGCADMAVKNNILYADNATDLVSIDITDPLSPKLIDRDKDVFPDLIPPDNGLVPSVYDKNNRPENTVIIKWVK